MRDPKTCVGLDVGGTAIKSGCVDEAGRVSGFDEHLWHRDGEPLTVLREIARRLVVGSDAIVGLACAGTIDEHGVLTHPTPHLPVATPAPFAQ